MDASHTLSVFLMSMAAFALVVSVWFAVRRPLILPTRGRGVWQATQGVLAALTATLAAVCVLLALGHR